MKIIRIFNILLVLVVLSSCESVPLTVKDFEVNGVKFRMIAVEGGSFMMGATPGQGDDARENEKPAHKVTVDDFYIGETEVTQELWFAVMGNNPSSFKRDDGSLPVENVSWNDVQIFIKKLNVITGQRFRLPFEAEWEYAARGGRKSTDKKYSGSDNVDEVSWNGDNSGGSPHSVASKMANELGIYDMSGNVWELCEDWYGEYFETEQINPRGVVGGNEMVVKGGGWFNHKDDIDRYRPSYRDKVTMNYKSVNGGFRIAI